jgi:uncharacterized membrane protein
MRLLGLAALALMALDAPAPVAAQDTEIVVRGDVARKEIQRILDADNLDTSRLSAAEVADAIGGIARGRAPEDFWTAYQTHVSAWNRLADAQGSLETALAEQAVEATFDEVERVARLYGAVLPIPPWQEIPTI